MTYFTSNKELNTVLLANRGQWFGVETDYLFDNQYNINIEGFGGVRIYDVWISEIEGDLRETSLFKDEFKGLTPALYDFGYLSKDNERFWKDGMYHNDSHPLAKYLKKDFTLEFRFSHGHYVLTNHRQTNFKFVYKDGKFYEWNGIGYKLCKSLKGKVRADQIEPLKALFAEHYKG